MTLQRIRRSVAVLASAAILGEVGMAVGLDAAQPNASARVTVRRLVYGSHHGMPGRPNIVFVLTDDLSLDLVRFMPHVLRMQEHGLTFTNYFVSDSLCCPSRASILSGRFPHDTGVLANFGPHGGFPAFHDRGEERNTFAVALHRRGYATAMMGKYLNGYMQPRGALGDGANSDVPSTYVPPGWSEWDVAGWGYPEFHYKLNENGHLRAYGYRPSDYLTDVLSRKGVGFIRRSARRHRPFFLELATFAPHSPFVPAPRDTSDFPRLDVPRLPNFDVVPTAAPRWLAHHPQLSAPQVAEVDSTFRRRAQAVQAVNRMIGRIENALVTAGVAGNTYIVFSSDNGLHTGEYRLMPGKLTAYDTDIHVPLVITGPGIQPGTSTDRMAENVDLAETFAALGHTRLAGDGHSLVPLLYSAGPAHWRSAILVEHQGTRQSVVDPDLQQPASGSPTTYEAMRTSRFLYVEYADGEREFYDLRSDPFELHNRVGSLTRSQLALLHRELLRMKRCHDGSACWNAMYVRNWGRV
jgi:N-acetylglucosamine-6-sulfatase